jgi:hypothetical protein
VLELTKATCFDRECLAAVAGIPQLQELWLDGGKQGPAPGLGECWGMLPRCPQLQRVTLQRCGPISQGALVALLSQPGMQAVVLRGECGLGMDVLSEMYALAGERFGCKLLVHERACVGKRADIFDISMD